LGGLLAIFGISNTAFYQNFLDEHSLC